VESKEISIEFDKNSLRVLKEVDKIHRTSLINLGIAMIEKTPYYQTLTGNADSNIANIASLSQLGEETEVKETTTIPQKQTKTESTPKKTTTWDDF